MAQPAAHTVAAPRGEEKFDQALWASYRKQVDAQRLGARASVDLYLQFLRAGVQSSPSLSPFVAITAWDNTIDTMHRKAKDPETAIKLCDEALALYKDHPRSAVLLGAKSRIFVYEGRNREAQAFIDANWSQIAQAPVSLSRRIFWYDCVALQAQNKKNEIPSFLKKALLQSPLLLDEEYQSTNGWMYRYLVRGLLEQGKTEEALSWAKLRWMECAFDDDHVQGAASLLAQAWSERGQDKTQNPALQQFIKSQQAKTAAEGGIEINIPATPLDDVPIPSLSQRELQAQLARLSSQPGDVLHEQNTHGRINLHILAGDWGRAMTEASDLCQTPTTVLRGIKEVTRVYKAHDLSLGRANAVLDWLETHQGPNPVEQFLKENPVKESNANGGGL